LIKRILNTSPVKITADGAPEVATLRVTAVAETIAETKVFAAMFVPVTDMPRATAAVEAIAERAVVEVPVALCAPMVALKQ
jgi:hypothetical protein